MTSNFADQVFQPTKRNGKTFRNLHNRIFAALSNAAGFVTLDALVAKTGAGSKKSVVTRITEMESILGRNFNKVTVATGASKGASQVAYSI